MFKKVRSLFSLESRLAATLQGSEQASGVKLVQLEKQIFNATQQLDKLESAINGRLSQIEVLFAAEIEARVKARDAAVKERRLNG